jgi:succinate dehydrogenase flavoprotein subunit
LTISEAIARSARERTESRGAHSRIDHPATDDKRWGHLNIAVAKAADGTMSVKRTKLPPMTEDQLALLGASGH